EHGWSRKGGPAIAELLDLHGLSLAAIGDGVEAKVVAHRVDLHQVVPRVGHDAAVPVQTAELAAGDLVDFARRDPEVFPALGDRRDLVADQVVAAIDLPDDVGGGTIPRGETRAR